MNSGAPVRKTQQGVVSSSCANHTHEVKTITKNVCPHDKNFTVTVYFVGPCGTPTQEVLESAFDCCVGESDTVEVFRSKILAYCSSQGSDVNPNAFYIFHGQAVLQDDCMPLNHCGLCCQSRQGCHSRFVVCLPRDPCLCVECQRLSLSNARKRAKALQRLLLRKQEESDKRKAAERAAKQAERSEAQRIQKQQRAAAAAAAPTTHKTPPAAAAVMEADHAQAVGPGHVDGVGDAGGCCNHETGVHLSQPQQLHAQTSHPSSGSDLGCHPALQDLDHACRACDLDDETHCAQALLQQNEADSELLDFQRLLAQTKIEIEQHGLKKQKRRSRHKKLQGQGKAETVWT